MAVFGRKKGRLGERRPFFSLFLFPAASSGVGAPGTAPAAAGPAPPAPSNPPDCHGQEQGRQDRGNDHGRQVDGNGKRHGIASLSPAAAPDRAAGQIWPKARVSRRTCRPAANPSVQVRRRVCYNYMRIPGEKSSASPGAAGGAGRDSFPIRP